MPIYDELQSDIQALRKYKQYEAALEWCKTNKKGAKAAVATKLWEDVSVQGLRLRLEGKVTNGEEFSDRRILTLVEEVQLAKWVRSENRAHRPQDRDKQRQKIVAMLELRKATRGTGRRYLPLSEVAKSVVADRGVHLPDSRWFQRFYAKFPDVVEEKLMQRERTGRAAKMNEAVVQNHFFGYAGLQAELKRTGEMRVVMMINAYADVLQVLWKRMGA